MKLTTLLIPLLLLSCSISKKDRMEIAHDFLDQINGENTAIDTTHFHTNYSQLVDGSLFYLNENRALQERIINDSTIVIKEVNQGQEMLFTKGNNGEFKLLDSKNILAYKDNLNFTVSGEKWSSTWDSNRMNFYKNINQYIKFEIVENGKYRSEYFEGIWLSGEYSGKVKISNLSPFMISDLEFTCFYFDKNKNQIASSQEYVQTSILPNQSVTYKYTSLEDCVSCTSDEIRYNLFLKE